MKKVILLLTMFSLCFVSCEGPEGPPGPPGLDGLNGLDGEALVGTVYEFTGDFTMENDFLLSSSFPNSENVLDSDVVLVYTLVAVDNGTDIWEPLPQTLFTDQGILLYTFDHTSFDVNVFMDGTVPDFGTLDTEFRNNKTFRVAIIPADFAESANTANIDSIMGAMNLTDQDVIKL